MGGLSFRERWGRTRTARRLAAWRFLRGRGIEIGAMHNPLPVPPWVAVRYVDRMDEAALRRHYPELSEYPALRVDLVDDGETLASLSDESQDFVIANSFLEHCEDPLRTLRNFARVLRPEGSLLLGIPDKRYTFDRDRAETPVEHILRDHWEGPDWSRAEHYRDWARHVLRVEGDVEIQAEASRLMHAGYSIHFHVWTREGVLEMMDAARTQLDLPLSLRAAWQLPQEVLVVLRRAA